MQKYTKTDTVNIKFNTLAGILQMVDEVIAENPHLSYSDFKVDAYESYENTIGVVLEYQRNMTTEEIAKVQQERMSQEERVRAVELATLERLKKKYAQ